MKFTFKTRYQIFRLEKTEADDNKEEYVFSHKLKGYDTPIGAEDVILSEGNPAKSHNFYTYAKNDVKESDKIVKFNEILGVDEEFIVKAVKIYGMGGLKRREAVIEKLEN